MLGRDGTIRQTSETARNRLTAALEGWVRKQELGASAGGGIPPARGPLTKVRDGRRLTLRLLAEGGSPCS